MEACVTFEEFDRIRRETLETLGIRMRWMENQIFYGTSITPILWPDSRDQEIMAANEAVLREVWEDHGEG